MLNIRLHTLVGKITDDGLDFPRTVQKRLSGDPIAKKFSTYKIQIRTATRVHRAIVIRES